MMIWKLFIGVLFPSLLGFFILWMMPFSRDLPGRIKGALSFGVGLGVITLWIFVLALFHISYTFWSVCAVLAVPFFLGVYRNKKEQHTLNNKVQDQSCFKWDIVSLILLGGIIFYLGFIFWRTLMFPICSWDAIATVGLKGKILYFTHSLEDIPGMAHAAYPLFTPLAMNWMALALGHWDDVYIKLFLPCGMVSLVMFSYFSFKKFVSQRWALFGVFCILGSALVSYHATIAYRDFYLMYYLFIGCMLLLLWVEERRCGYLLLSSVFYGLATFVKVEGSLYLALAYTILAGFLFLDRTKSFLNKIKCLGVFVMPSGFICLGFHLYRAVRGIQLEEKAMLSLGHPAAERFYPTLIKVMENLFLTGNWNLVWFLFIVSLFHVRGIRSHKVVQFLLLLIILHFTLIFFLSMFTHSFIWLAGVSAITGLSRIILHFYPMAIIFIVLVNGRQTHKEEFPKGQDHESKT
ncbi:MAG: hypothetical protein KC713_05635 [Candidatus Omnitrophica bacterium]|nr:hypothetical protein [Candidatus Omnitrophota bacterium]